MALEMDLSKDKNRLGVDLKGCYVRIKKCVYDASAKNDNGVSLYVCFYLNKSSRDSEKEEDQYNVRAPQVLYHTTIVLDLQKIDFGKKIGINRDEFFTACYTQLKTLEMFKNAVDV